jgi:hypothetical protein
MHFSQNDYQPEDRNDDETALSKPALFMSPRKPFRSIPLKVKADMGGL